MSYELINRLGNQENTNVQIIAWHGHRLLSPLFILSCLPTVVMNASSADVIHLGDPMLSFVGWIIKNIFHKPVAVTVHGLDITYPNFLYQLYLYLFFRHFDLYLPISTYVAGLLSVRKIIPIKIIHPAIDDVYYNPFMQRASLDEIVGQKTADKKILLTTGRLVARKGHAWFIEHVLPKLPANVLYIVAGSGPEKNRVEQVAQNAGVKEKVLMLGRVSEEHLKIVYNTADVFIQPNVKVTGDVEGFGLVLLEAALCNLPIFASNIEGISDAIIDGQNGRLLPAENAEAWVQELNTFLTNPQHSVSARNYTLEHFNWDKTTEQFSEALNSLL